jgi:homoserine dehydrogenase
LDRSRTQQYGSPSTLRNIGLHFSLCIDRPPSTYKQMATSAASTAAAAASGRPFRVGLLGGGVVGGGAYELIQRHLRGDGVSGGNGVVVSRICVRDVSKPRDYAIDPAVTSLTTNPDDLLTDPDIDCVVEVMGGSGPGSLASRFVNAALRDHQKAVVTANKALLASELDSLNALSAQSKTPLLFEAAVCGGIPIIHTLQSCFAADTIRKVAGICNGTTNYMLGKMEAGHDYGEALKEAQQLGYAEADPTADVEGHDVRAKICLLAKLAFGTTISQESVSCRGISHLTSQDFANAARLNSTIKLLGVAHATSSGASSATTSPLPSPPSSISVYVTPHMVGHAHALASARGSGNVVLVESDNMGLTTYTGPGAGRYPTANSVVADVARLAAQFHALNNNGGAAERVRVTTATAPFPLNTALPVETDYEHSGDWYVRLLVVDQGAAPSEARLEAAADATKVRIVSLDHLPEFVVLAPSRSSAVQAFCREVGSTTCMPIISS